MKWRRARMILAAAGLVGLVGGAVVTTWVADWQPCERVTEVTNSSMVTVTSCAALTLTSPVVLLGLLAVLALISPELASLEIPGLLRIERKVAEVDAAAGRVERSVNALTASMAQNLNVTIQAHDAFLPDDVDVQADDDRITDIRKRARTLMPDIGEEDDDER